MKENEKHINQKYIINTRNIQCHIDDISHTDLENVLFMIYNKFRNEDIDIGIDWNDVERTALLVKNTRKKELLVTCWNYELILKIY